MKLTRAFVFAPALLATLLLSAPVHAQAVVAREVIETAAEQVFKQASREGLEQLSEMGGKTAVREILAQSSREGGDALVAKVTRYGIEDGPRALRVIRPSPARMVEALDGLSPELRTAALSAAERQPQLITQLVGKYGSGALEVAAKHPGVGEKVVATLGEDGVQLGRQLGTDETIVLARNAEDLSRLAPAEKAGVLQAIRRSPSRVLQYLESHPRTLRTAAGVAVVMAIKDDLIGDRGSSTVLPDGRVINRAGHPGLIERLLPPTYAFLATPLTVLVSVAAAGVGGWFLIHLWGAWKMGRLRHTLAAAQAARSA